MWHSALTWRMNMLGAALARVTAHACSHMHWQGHHAALSAAHARHSCMLLMHACAARTPRRMVPRLPRRGSMHGEHACEARTAVDGAKAAAAEHCCHLQLLVVQVLLQVLLQGSLDLAHSGRNSVLHGSSGHGCGQRRRATRRVA
jgi:hypothetical protein